MKAPGFKQVDEGFVRILACSLGWLLAENGVGHAVVKSWSLDLEMMNELAGPDLEKFPSEESFWLRLS